MCIYLNDETISRTCFCILSRLSSTSLNSFRKFSNSCRSAFSSAIFASIHAPFMKMFTVSDLSSGAWRTSSLIACSIWRSLATVMSFSLRVTFDGAIIFDGPLSCRFGAGIANGDGEKLVIKLVTYRCEEMRNFSVFQRASLLTPFPSETVFWQLNLVLADLLYSCRKHDQTSHFGVVLMFLMKVGFFKLSSSAHHLSAVQLSELIFD